MSNNTKYVRDAFKSLELVEDKEFDLFGKDSFEELGDFIDTDDDVEVEQEVIDLDANEPEELKDSYVGDVILSCPVCHANMFKEIGDVVIDEETELCCVGDPCPVCGQEDGFKVIGKVAPFEESEEEEETEVEVETEPEEAEAEVEVKEKVRESFKKRVADKRLQEKRTPAHRKLMEKVCKDCGKEVCECDKEEKPAKKPIRIKATGNMVEIPIEKKDRPLKEEKGDLNKLDKDIQDIVGDHFGYTMNFDFLDIVADVLLRVDDFENEDLWDTVDSTLIYADDQWEVLEHYVDSPADLSDGSWDDAFAQFVNDLEEICRKVAAQRGGEEVSESKKSSNKGKKLSESKYQIKEVSSDEAGDIINNRKPLGLFLQKDGNTFVAIDNSTGDAWTEEFKNRKSAEKWLLSADESLKKPAKGKKLSESNKPLRKYYSYKITNGDLTDTVTQVGEYMYTIQHPNKRYVKNARASSGSDDRLFTADQVETYKNGMNMWIVDESVSSPNSKKLSEAVSDYAKEDIKREIERIVDEYFKGTDFFVSVSDIDFDAGKVTLDISALGGYDEDSDEVEELNREVEFDIPNLDLEDYFAAQLEDWMNTHNSPDNFYESKKLTEYKKKKESFPTRKLNEDWTWDGQVPEIAEKVEEQIGDRTSVTWDEFEMFLDTAIMEVLGLSQDELIGIVGSNDQTLTVDSKPKDYYELDNDVRTILSMNGWETIFEGDNEGGLRLLESKKLTEAPVYDLNPQFDSRKSFYSKAKVDTGDKGDKNKLYSYNTLVAELKDGKPVVYGTFSSTTLRHIKDWLKQLGFKADNAKQIMADYGVKEESVSEGIEKNRKLVPGDAIVVRGNKAVIKDILSQDVFGDEIYIEFTDENGNYRNWKSTLDGGTVIYKESLTKDDGKSLTESGKEQITVKWGDVFNERQQGRLASLKGQKIDRGTAEQISNAISSYLSKKNFDLKDLMPKIDFDNETFICNVEKEKEMSLGEDIEKATIETDDQVIKVSSEPKEENMNADWFDHDGGELLPDDQDEEMIAPLNDEDIAEIEAAQEEPEENTEEPAETEEENPEDEEEFEFDEIQEESFKRITESYLKKVYSNVRSFKINNLDVNENLLKIDGTIRFNSGNKKDTTFVFESAKNEDTIAKSKKRFVGLNETFTDKKDAFVLNTVVDNKKFIAESLSYDYPAKTKDLNESVKTVKGIVK